LSARFRLAPTPRPARSPAEIDGALELRVRVFCGEQGVSRRAELDGLDDEAFHIVSMERGKVIGTCRLRFVSGDCRLERMAVDAGSRGIGIGARMIEVAEAEGRRRGSERLSLHSQLAARGFYERNGLRATGEEVFLEEGIEHVRMGKEL
jgi:predicted GNAT family N-acyltransferase